MVNNRRMRVVAFACAMALLRGVSPMARPGDSPVADAAMRGDIAAVRAALQQGADVNGGQGDGMTALHWAAERGDQDLAKLLLGSGASPAVETRIGRYTPLHIASKKGRDLVIRALVDANADVGALTATGAASLHFAAASGNREAVT